MSSLETWNSFMVQKTKIEYVPLRWKLSNILLLLLSSVQTV